MGLQDELEYIEQVRKERTFGCFVDIADLDYEPHTSNLLDKYRITGELAETDYRQHRNLFSGNKFSAYVDRIAQYSHPNVEQCSPKYYYDLINYIDKHRQIQHICDVGVYLGGCAAYLAQLSVDLDLTLDLVDINPCYLGFTYERVTSIIPESSSRVRMFHGDFPTYVKHLIVQRKPAFVQFDASHRFPDVVRDMVSIGKVRSYVQAFSIQDTHLRSELIEAEVFVDLAIHAVFGKNPVYTEIGTRTSAEPVYIPGHEWKIYLRPNAPEGVLLEMSENTVQYDGR